MVFFSSQSTKKQKTNILKLGLKIYVFQCTLYARRNVQLRFVKKNLISISGLTALGIFRECPRGVGDRPLCRRAGGLL